MANRVVNVRLLVSASQFNQGMLQSGASVRVLANSLGTTSQQAAAANDRLESMAKVAAVAGAAITGAFAYGIKIFADFDQQMSSVQAATGATAAEMGSLRKAAVDAGRDTFYSSTEAAKGIEELAKAGVSAADITGGALTGALNLAAAGGIDVGEAAGTAASAMVIFGLSGENVAGIADTLAAAAGKAQGSVHDVSMAMNQSALVAKNTGLSLLDTSGALAMFASNGLVGSDAGTSFKTMLMSLNPRSQQAAALMDELGLRAYDASGSFVGMSKYAEQLKAGLGSLTQEQRNSAMQTIFGTDAVRAATILYNEGSAGVDKWKLAVSDSGYAAAQAAARMDNLNGDIEQQKGSIESAILGAGSGANDVLRFMAQSATNVVNGFSSLPGPLQQVAVGFAGIGGPALIALSAATMFYTKISAMQAQMMLGGTASQAFAGALGKMKWGIAGAIPVLALATVALELYGRKKAEAKKITEDFTSSIAADNGALGENTRKLIAQKNASNGVSDAAKTLGLSAADITDALTGNATASAKVAARLKEVTDASTKANEAAGSYGPGGGGQMDKSMQSNADAANTLAQAMASQQQAISGAMQHWINMNAALDGGTAEQKEHAKVVQATTDALMSQASAADALKKALDSLNATSLDVREADINFLDSLQKLSDGLTTTVNGVDVFSTTLDINTEAGRNNQSNMIASIKAAQDAAIAHTQVTNSVQAGIDVYEQNIKTLFKQMATQGASKDELDAFRASVIDMPALKQILVEAQTQQAELALYNLTRDRVAKILYSVEINSADGAPRPDMYLGPDGGFPVTKAGGGIVHGAGTSTSDSIPARLSDGEFVVKASVVNKYGQGFFDRLNGGGVPITDAGAYSSMRSVTYSASPSGGMGGSPDVVAAIADLSSRMERLTSAHAETIVRSNEDVADRARLGAMAGSSSVNR